MATRILRDAQDFTRWGQFLRGQDFPMTVSHAKGAKRSLQQNATAHMWYGQIAGFYGDQSPAEAKAECKFRFGRPILERDNPAWVDEWKPLYAPLPYRHALKLFEVLPVTSKMTTKQKAEYMTEIQREYLAQGIPLVDPEARKYEGVA